MGRRASRVIATIAVIAGMWTMGHPTAAAYSHTRRLSPSDLLKRSFSVMAAVRTVHGTGRFTEREVELNDFHSTGSWRVQGDCLSTSANTTSKFSVQGRQTGRHVKAVDESYVARVTPGPGNLPVWRWSWQVWMHIVRPANSWHRVGMTHDARVVTSLCPSLIVRQLRLHLPGPVEDMGRTTIRGRHAVYLQSAFNGEGSGATVVVYVDLASFRWLRVELSGWGAGCCHAYHDRIDYSRYNAPVTIRLPSARVLS